MIGCQMDGPLVVLVAVQWITLICRIQSPGDSAKVSSRRSFGPPPHAQTMTLYIYRVSQCKLIPHTHSSMSRVYWVFLCRSRVKGALNIRELWNSPRDSPNQDCGTARAEACKSTFDPATPPRRCKNPCIPWKCCYMYEESAHTAMRGERKALEC